MSSTANSGIRPLKNTVRPFTEKKFALSTVNNYAYVTVFVSLVVFESEIILKGFLTD